MAGIFDMFNPLTAGQQQQSLTNAVANTAMAQNAIGGMFKGLQTAFGDDNHNASGWYHKKGIMERIGGLASGGAGMIPFM